MRMSKAYLNWSGGKDAAMALYLLRNREDIRVEKLVTTIDFESSRVTMHNLRRDLLEEQARQLGLPLHIISLPGSASLSEYNYRMKQEIALLGAQGFSQSVFGDIFLEDLRNFREGQFQNTGIHPVFPLWGIDTHLLMKNFISAGFKAITISVNAKVLDKSFCGRIIDQAFLSALPPNVDPAGENGEFHTFVFDGPLFKYPVNFEIGKIYEQVYPSSKKEVWDSHFWFCDLRFAANN